MLRRPFKTETHRDLLPYGGDLQVFVRLHPDLMLTDQIQENLNRPFQDLAMVGAWGGMAGDAFFPPTSSMALLTAADVIVRNELMWIFAVTDIHPGTLLVIENLVHYLHLNVGRVEMLRLHSGLLSTGKPVSGQLPCDYEPYPFSVEYNMESAQVLVDADFEDRHEVRQLEPFRQAWNAWEGIAIQGGFADETYSPEKASLAVEDELRLTSTGFSGAFDDVNIADAGFYCLVNMLETLHHRVVPITSVIIE